MVLERLLKCLATKPREITLNGNYLLCFSHEFYSQGPILYIKNNSLFPKRVTYFLNVGICGKYKNLNKTTKN